MTHFVKRYIYVVCYHAVIASLRKHSALILDAFDEDIYRQPTPQYEYYSDVHARWIAGLHPWRPAIRGMSDRAVTVEFEDGTEIYYEGVVQASKDLDVNRTTILNWLKKGPPQATEQCGVVTRQSKYYTQHPSSPLIRRIFMTQDFEPIIFAASPLKKRKRILRETWNHNPSYSLEYEYNEDNGSTWNEWYTLYAHKTLRGEGLLVKEKYDDKKLAPAL